MRDKIIRYLDSDSKAKTIIEINDYLKLESSEELKDLQDELNNLVRQGIIHETKKNKYILMSNCASLYSGRIEITKNGYGFLINDTDIDIYVSQDNLNGAINDDMVLIDTFYRNGKMEGKVLKILERNIKRLTGEVKIVDNNVGIILDDKKLDLDIELENDYANLVDGHKVLIELGNEIGNKRFKAKVVKIIGHKNDPGVDILTIACKHGIELEFSDEVMAEVAKIPDKVSDKDKVGRVDLTKDIIFTIDGDDTKDIDDAISIKKEKDIYVLGVHIADVTYYVKPNTKLYNEAYQRGTSSYLADTVIPMLPHELSNGICSLNPLVERLAISCVMKINSEGKVVDYDIFPSVIKSRIQMTYKNVNNILNGGKVPKDYKPFKEDLLLMAELASILRKKKVQNGYIDFNIPEVKVIQDETGKCIDLIKREQNVGEKLIEDFMIAANETVATHISNMGLPFIYRIHGIPKEEKMADFLSLLTALNIRITTKGFNNRNIQNILKEIKGRKEEPVLASMLLRCMQKAIYSPNNIGHFGLGLKYYTHFTSPIRRFPDTTVHQLLRTYLFNKEINNETINYYNKYLNQVGEYTSSREQEAIEAEREVDAMKMAEYMESHIGEEYDGVITNVTNFGFFVQLPNLVEGLVHVNTLNGYYTFVPDLFALISKDKSISYQLGKDVRIKVISANKDTQTIDFEVIDGNNK